MADQIFNAIDSEKFQRNQIILGRLVDVGDSCLMAVLGIKKVLPKSN